MLPSKKVYQFGGGEKRASQGIVKIPIVIGDRKIMISIELVDASIPLLIGSNSMEAGKAIMNFGDKTATFFGEEVPMFKVGSGDVCIDLLSQYIETHINDAVDREQAVQVV